MREIRLKGRVIVEGKCKGEALASTRPISFLGGVDPTNGVIVEKEHELCGKSVKDKVLCFSHGHGSTVGSYVLYSLAKKALAPKAIINQTADPVVVVGAILANIPMIDRIDVRRINSGDVVEVDACRGVVKILSKKAR